MKINVTLDIFIEAFEKYGHGQDFTRDGFKALYGYLIQMEDSHGEERELRVIDTCRGYDEYCCLGEFQIDYGCENYPTMESIKKETVVIMINEESFLIQYF